MIVIYTYDESEFRRALWNAEGSLVLFGRLLNIKQYFILAWLRVFLKEVSMSLWKPQSHILPVDCIASVTKLGLDHSGSSPYFSPA